MGMPPKIEPDTIDINNALASITDMRRTLHEIGQQHPCIAELLNLSLIHLAIAGDRLRTSGARCDPYHFPIRSGGPINRVIGCSCGWRPRNAAGSGEAAFSAHVARRQAELAALAEIAEARELELDQHELVPHGTGNGKAP